MLKMKILLIDNYDSFTHNLAHDLRAMDEVQLTIIRNDQLALDDVRAYDGVLISPGPGLPKDNGSIVEVIQRYYRVKPMLGICLGLQAIYEAFGGKLINLPRVRHGVTSSVTILDPEDTIFQGIPNPFFAGRYHSWVCDKGSLPDELIITATDESDTIMACRHSAFPLHGIQFHPESILTPEGKTMIRNFMICCRQHIIKSLQDLPA